MGAAKALVSLCISASSPEPSLFGFLLQQNNFIQNDDSLVSPIDSGYR